MKIKQKIALFYALATFLILAIVMTLIYILTVKYTNDIFYNYLQEKAILIGNKSFERDELNTHEYEKILIRYSKTMPQTTEVIVDANNKRSVYDTLKNYISISDIDKLLQNDKVIRFTHNGKSGVAIFYPDNEGNFVILAMEKNEYGISVQTQLRNALIIIIIISSILVYFVGRIYAIGILSPLKHILREIDSIKGTDLNLRLKSTNSKDELEELINTLNHMLERLEIAFESQKGFIANASHELNNPLTAIMGECEISMMKEQSPEQYISSIQRIYQETERLVNLIKSLMSLAKADLDILLNNIEPIDISSFIKENTDKERIIYNNKTNIIKPIIINANPYLLSIAINNIINNALKYSKSDVEINLYYEKKDIRIEIKDNGIGIPLSDQPHILQSFYRASNTRGYSGQGIGLTLTEKIIKFYGGSISINSELNKYTCVNLTFTTACKSMI